MSNRITKPTRSNRKSGSAKPNANAADVLTAVFAALKASGIEIPENVAAIAETPVTKPAELKHEKAEAFGGVIWCNHQTGRVWFDADNQPKIDEVLKAFKFSPAEYIPKSERK